MTTIQEIKKGKKASVTGTAQKIKTRKEARVTGADQKTKTEEVVPVSKYKEWKLLYTPYPFSTNSNNPSPMTNSQSKPLVEYQNSGMHKGLCKNCKKNETCQLPKPEGGIWRCEDYE